MDNGIMMESVVKLERAEENVFGWTMTPCRVKEEGSGEEPETEDLEECERPLLVLLPDFQEEEAEENNEGEEEEMGEHIVHDGAPVDTCWRYEHADSAIVEQSELALSSYNIQKHLPEDGYTDSLCGFCKTVYSMTTCPALCDHNYAGHICVCPREALLRCDVCSELCPGVHDLYRHLLNHVKAKHPHLEEKRDINNETVVKSPRRVRKQRAVKKRADVQVQCDEHTRLFGIFSCYQNNCWGVEQQTKTLWASHDIIDSSEKPLVGKMKAPEALLDRFSPSLWQWTGPVKQYRNRRRM